MYALSISAVVAVLVGASGVLAGWWSWPWGIVFGSVAFLACWVLVVRRFGRRLQTGLETVRRQAEAGQLALAIQSLADLRPLGRWIPRLEPQIDAQIGVLSFHSGDEEAAIRHLTAAGPRVGDAQVVLAALLQRKGETARALAVLTAAASRNRRHPLLHNMLAWLLQKQGSPERAMEVLAKYLRKEAKDDIGRENLLRLQNDQRVDMKAFGETWYALGLERPPASLGQVRTARKGFRQPPRKRGRQPKTKTKKKK